MSYSHNEKYFADIASEIVAQGVNIIGGCCGTTPGHIALIRKAIDKGITFKKETKHSQREEYILASAPKIDLLVEVPPPLKAETSGLMNKIEKLKQMGVKHITLPDSPLGRARMNPLMVSCSVRDKCDVNTITHLCCRDRNVTALRSDILAAWSLGLRHVLCVTGDPVAAGSRDNIKSVFNITGTRLVELIGHMNAEFFSDEPIKLYAAVDFSVPNFKAELNRAKKKKEAGADVFLSQPIYSDEAIENIKLMKDEMDAKIYAGILPPVSLRNALFLKNEVPGIRIPDKLIAEFENADEVNHQTVGVKYSVDIAKRAMEYADGIYLMLPFGKISVAAEFFNIYNSSL
jgi:homocysteine S-methyltransferase